MAGSDSRDILPAPLGPTARFEIQPRTFRLHYATEQELHDLAELSLFRSVNLAFTTLGVGAAISFAIVLGTVSTLETKQFATFVALLALSLVVTLYCGIRTYFDFRRSSKLLSESTQREA